jgi:hypothetical protein
MHLTVDSVIRRLLVYRLIRYRFAWLAFGLLGLYLAGILVVVICSAREANATGTVVNCRAVHRGSGGQGTELFQLAGRPGAELELTAAHFHSAPSSLCSRPDQVVSVGYVTNALRDPERVDMLILTEPQSGAATVYRDGTMASFELVKHVRLALFGGGMTLVSLIMLGVGLWWRRCADVARKTKPSRRPERPSQTQAHFTAQIERDMNWLRSLPWGASPASVDRRTAYLAFHRGVALVRG